MNFEENDTCDFYKQAKQYENTQESNHSAISIPKNQTESEHPVHQENDVKNPIQVSSSSQPKDKNENENQGDDITWDRKLKQKLQLNQLEKQVNQLDQQQCLQDEQVNILDEAKTNQNLGLQDEQIRNERRLEATQFAPQDAEEGIIESETNHGISSGNSSKQPQQNTQIQQAPFQNICELFKNENSTVNMGYNSALKSFIVKKESKFIQENDKKIIKLLSEEDITLPLVDNKDSNDIEQIAGQKNLSMLKQSCADLFTSSFLSNDHARKQKAYDSFISLIFMRLIQKLQKMHSLEYAHSDIKPLNIVVGYDFDVYFIDFDSSIHKNHINRYLHSCTQYYNLGKYLKPNKGGDYYDFTSWDEVQICDLTQLALTILFMIIDNMGIEEQILFGEKKFEQFLKKYQQQYPKVVYMISYLLNQGDENIKVLGDFKELQFKVDISDIQEITQYVFDVSYNSFSNQFAAKRINQFSIHLIDFIQNAFGSIQIDPSQMDIIPSLPYYSNTPEEERQKIFQYRRSFKEFISKHKVIDNYFRERSNSSNDQHYLQNMCRQFQISSDRSFSLEIYTESQIIILLKELNNLNQSNLSFNLYFNKASVVQSFLKQFHKIQKEYLITGIKFVDLDQKFHKISLQQSESGVADNVKLTLVHCQYLKQLNSQTESFLKIINCKSLQVIIQARSEIIPPNYNTVPYSSLASPLTMMLNKYKKNIGAFSIGISIKTISKLDHRIFRTFDEVNKHTIDRPHDRMTLYDRLYDVSYNNQDMVIQALSTKLNIENQNSKLIFGKFKREIENKGLEPFQVLRQVETLMTNVYTSKAIKVIIKFNNIIFFNNYEMLLNALFGYFSDKPEIQFELILNDSFFNQATFVCIQKFKEIKKRKVDIQYESSSTIPEQTFYKVNIEFVTPSAQQQQEPPLKIIFRTSHQDISNAEKGVINNQVEEPTQQPIIQVNKPDLIKLLNSSDFSKLLKGVETFDKFSVLTQNPVKVKLDYCNLEIDHFTVFRNEGLTSQKIQSKNQLKFIQKEFSTDYFSYLNKNHSKFININCTQFSPSQDVQQNSTKEIKIIDLEYLQIYNTEKTIDDSQQKFQQLASKLNTYVQDDWEDEDEYEDDDDSEEFQGVHKKDSNHIMVVSLKKYFNVGVIKQNAINHLMKFFSKPYFMDDVQIPKRIAFKISNQIQSSEEIKIDSFIFKSTQNHYSLQVFSSLLEDICNLRANIKQIVLQSFELTEEHLELIQKQLAKSEKFGRIILDVTHNESISIQEISNFLKQQPKSPFISVEINENLKDQKHFIDEMKKDLQEYEIIEKDNLVIQPKNLEKLTNCLYLKFSHKSRDNSVKSQGSLLQNDEQDIRQYEDNILLIDQKNNKQDQHDYVSQNWIVIDDQHYRNYISSYYSRQPNQDNAPKQVSFLSDNDVIQVLIQVIEKQNSQQSNLIDLKNAHEKISGEANKQN